MYRSSPVCSGPNWFRSAPFRAGLFQILAGPARSGPARSGYGPSRSVPVRSSPVLSYVVQSDSNQLHGTRPFPFQQRPIWAVRPPLVGSSSVRSGLFRTGPHIRSVPVRSVPFQASIPFRISPVRSERISPRWFRSVPCTSLQAWASQTPQVQVCGAQT